MSKTLKPSPEEIGRLRKDAGEGDLNASAFFRARDDNEKANAALAEWRRGQVTSSDK